HAEAARGVPFERMGILLRAPGPYRSAVAEALARADIPAYFARGTRGPDPSGRAFLSLLACADERLSARRFAEYLSLGQVPAHAVTTIDTATTEAPTAPAPGPGDEQAAAAATADGVPAPRKWEQMLVE